MAIAFLPHKVCLLSDWNLIWIDVVADQTIAVSYYIIGSLLLLLCLRPSKLARFIGFISLRGAWILRSGGIAFGLFILLCGITHQMNTVIIWNPAYRLEAALKVATATMSAITTVGFLALVQRFAHDEGGYRMVIRRLVTGR